MTSTTKCHVCRKCGRPFLSEEFPSNNAKTCFDCLHEDVN